MRWEFDSAHSAYAVRLDPSVQPIYAVHPSDIDQSTSRLVCLETMVLREQQSPLSVADCYHLVRTKSLGLTEIHSFDKRMDHHPGVIRSEP